MTRARPAPDAFEEPVGAAGQAPLVTMRFFVQMADTDAAGIIYFAAPFPWAERLHTAWLRKVGLPVSTMLATGSGLPVVQALATYRSPLRLDDEVEGTLWLERQSDRSLTQRAEFAKVGVAGPPAVEVLLTHVFVEGEGAEIGSAPLPRVLRDPPEA